VLVSSNSTSDFRLLVMAGKKVSSCPEVFLLPNGWLAVVCDKLQDQPFTEAATLLQDVCDADSKSVQRLDTDCAADGPDVLPICTALKALDGAEYALWNFAICTLTSGRHAGTKAVAIGSNVKKRERAGNLALAIAVASKSEPRMAEACSSVFAQLVNIAHQEQAAASADTQDCQPPPPPSQPSSPVFAAAPLEASAASWLSGAGYGVYDDAAPPPPPPPARSSQVMRQAMVSPWSPAPPADEVPPPPPPPTAQRMEAYVLKRELTPTTREAVSIRAASEEDSEDEEVLYAVPLNATAPAQHRTAAAWLGPEASAAVEQPEAAEQPEWKPFEGDHYLPDDPTHGCSLASLRASQDSDSSASDRESLRNGLLRPADYDAVTINTLAATDNIPLGTDTDPFAYNNVWAASQVKNAHGKALLTHDLAVRILDAENIGFTFGHHVHHQNKYFDVEGVKRAADFFIQQGLRVIVIGKRPLLREALSGLACSVLISDDDDVFIFKKAFELKCPIVSRDLFRDYFEDYRINFNVRQWLQNGGARLRVGFSFDDQGKFYPTSDLAQQPVLRRKQR